MPIPLKIVPEGMADVRKAIEDVRTDAARGVSLNVSAGRQGLAGGGNTATASAVLGASAPAAIAANAATTSAGMRGRTESQYNARYRAQVALDAALTGENPERLAALYTEAAQSFAPGSVQSINYHTTAARYNNRATRQRTRADEGTGRAVTRGQRGMRAALEQLADEELRAEPLPNDPRDVPEGFWGGDADEPPPRANSRRGVGRSGGNGTGRSGRARSPWDLSGRRILGMSVSGGLQRYLSVGFAARAAVTAIDAGRDLRINEMIAGGDQGQMLEAQLHYREQIAGSFGFVSQAVAYMQDPGGSETAYVKAQLGESRVQEQATARMREVSDFRRDITDQYRMSQQATPAKREIQNLINQRDAVGAEFQKLGERDTALTAAQLQSKRGMQASSRDDAIQRELNRSGVSIIGPGGPGGAANVQYGITREEAERRVDASNERVLSGIRGKGDERRNEMEELRKVREKTLNDEIGRLQSEENERNYVASRGAGADAAIANDLAAGRNDSARLRSIAFQGEMDIRASITRGDDTSTTAQIGGSAIAKYQAAQRGIARERGFNAQDSAARASITQSLLDRNPLQAAEREIEHARETRLRDPKLTFEELAGIHSEANKQIDLARQGDADTKRYRAMELNAEREGLELAADNRPMAGRARTAMLSAIAKATQLREQANDPSAANLVLGNAALEQKALRKQVFEGFESKEIDPTLTAMNGPRRGESIEKYLADIAQNTARLLASQTTGGTGNGSFTTE